MIHGCLLRSDSRPELFRKEGGYFWKVVKDPSGLFIGNLFRFVDLKAGGFDPGTTFQHISTGEQHITDMNGMISERESNGKNLSSARHAKCKTIHEKKAAPSRLRATRNPDRRLPA